MGSFLVFFFKLVLSAACRYEQTSEQTNKLLSLKKDFQILEFPFINCSLRYGKSENCYSMLRNQSVSLVTIVTRSKIPQSEERLLQVFQFLGGPLNLTCSITLAEQKKQPHIPLCLNLTASPPPPLSIRKLTSTWSSECCI